MEGIFSEFTIGFLTALLLCFGFYAFVSLYKRIRNNKLKEMFEGFFKK